LKCPWGCGWEGEAREYIEHLETCPKREERLPVTEVETGKVTFIKPIRVREATFEELHMATVWDAMNITYNTWVESPPKVLHEDNVDKFVQFSHQLFNSQKIHGVNVDKFRDAFHKQLNYYLKFVEELRRRR